MSRRLPSLCPRPSVQQLHLNRNTHYVLRAYRTNTANQLSSLRSVLLRLLDLLSYACSDLGSDVLFCSWIGIFPMNNLEPTNPNLAREIVKFRPYVPKHHSRAFSQNIRSSNSSPRTHQHSNLTDCASCISGKKAIRGGKSRSKLSIFL